MLGFKLILVKSPTTKLCIEALIRETTNTPSALLALCERMHRSPVDSPHKGPVIRKALHVMTSSSAFSYRY